jgi:hypothetical protein
MRKFTWFFLPYKCVYVFFCREIDRLQRENKLLERQFEEIKARSEELAAEMLQLSEQVTRLDEGQPDRDATVSRLLGLREKKCQRGLDEAAWNGHFGAWSF